MLSLSSFNVYVDPNLKQVDNTVMDEIKHLCSIKNLELYQSLNFTTSKGFPHLIFFSDNNLCLKPQVGITDINFYVKVVGDNLNFFSSLDDSEDVFSISGVEEISMVFTLFETYYLKYSKQYSTKLKEYSQKLLSNLKKKTKISLIDDGIYLKVEEFERELYSVATLEEMNTLVASSSKRLFGVELAFIDKTLLDLDNQPIFYGLTLFDNEVIYLHEVDSKLSEELLLAIILVLQERIDVLGLYYRHVHELNYWEVILNTIDLPIVQFNENSQLVIHNKYFPALKLSSSECYKYENNHEVKIIDINYRIIRKSFMNGELFFFVPQEASTSYSDKPSSEELGIVSSSIAHELNNPLAGVMAALDVLLLDDYDDCEIAEKFQEMKQGVSRCKKLVETFLGFSKVSANHKALASVTGVKDSLTQAMDLLRFRIIENNIKFDYQLDSKATFTGEYNPHILTMTFYLILGELLTSSSHQQLIENSEHCSLEIEITETKGRITLKADVKLNQSSTFWSSKLFNHLLESDNIAVHVDDYEVRLSCL